MMQSALGSELGYSGDQAFTWRIWLIASGAPQLLLLAFGNYPEFNTGLLAFVVATSCSAPFILWLGPVVIRRAHSRVSRTWTVLCIYFLASSAIAVTISSVIVGRIDALNVASGVIFHTWFFLLVSELVNDRVEFIQQMSRLETVRTQLEQVQQWREKNLISAKKTEVARISAQLELTRERISAALETGASVQGLNNEVIRGLLVGMDEEFSHPSPLKSDPTAPTQRSRTFKRVLIRALSPQTFVAPASAAFFATTWLVTGLSMSSWLVSVLAPVLGGAVLFVAVSLFRKLNFRLVIIAPRAVTMVLVIVLWLISSVIAGIGPVFVAGLPMETLIPIGLQTTLIMFVIAVVIAYRDLGVELSNTAAYENEQLERELVKNNTVFRDLRERLRRFVHGDLQNIIVAAERKLNSRSATQPQNELSLLDSITNALNGFEEFINSETEIPTPKDTVRDLRTMWQGILSIEYVEAEQATRLIAQNYVTSTVVSELLMEMVTNTAKHDRATHAHIEITLGISELLEVKMSSQGATSASFEIHGGHSRRSVDLTSGGQGSRLFNDVCLTWSLSHIDGDTTFTAIVPLISHLHQGSLVRTP